MKMAGKKILEGKQVKYKNLDQLVKYLQSGIEPEDAHAMVEL